MKTSIKLGLLLIALAALVTGCAKCGDGVCQNREAKKANCPVDCAEKPTNYTLKSLKIIKESGGNLDWHHENNLIAYSKLQSDGYYDVHLMKPDGSSDKCLTCNKPELPGRHTGGAVWHPSGDYLIFQAQKKSAPKTTDTKCTPGAGMLNDFYVITADGKQSWLLYAVRDEVSAHAAGVLHPHFSPDGKKLIWSERTRDNGRLFGEWVIKIADFSFEANTPKVSNIKTLSPGTRTAFFETHSFSPDGTKFLFTGTQDGPLEIYEMELTTEKVKRLTTDAESWDEHAHYSPDGTKIVWMSSKGLKYKSNPFELETEFWIMDADGTNKRQLTYLHDPSHEHYMTSDSGFVVAADSCWGPLGKHIMALVITADPNTDKRHEGRLVMLEFE